MMETTIEENGLKKGPWTPEEDRKLIDCIQKYGHGSWKELPRLAGLNRWSAIASYLPGRTDNEIKNLWNTRLKKKLLRNGIDPDTHMPRTHFNTFLPVLPQYLGCNSSENHTWENVVRSQVDAASLAKILLIGNILQLLNSGTSPPLTMETLSPMMGLQMEGLTPNNTLACQPDSVDVPRPVLQNTIETNSGMEINNGGLGESSMINTDHAVPDLVSASPARSSTDREPNNFISQTEFSIPPITFDGLGDLMDDKAINYYWKQVLDQATLSP